MNQLPSTHETQFSRPSEREFSATRHFDAPRESLWMAHTDPRHVPHWALGPEGWTMPVCDIDLRPGGRWHWVWRDEQGREMEMDGVYEEVTEPSLLVNTENWGGEWPETLNTLVLTEENGGTRVTVTVLYPTENDLDKALATGMTDGMAMSYDRLERYLANMG